MADQNVLGFFCNVSATILLFGGDSHGDHGKMGVCPGGTGGGGVLLPAHSSVYVVGWQRFLRRSLYTVPPLAYVSLLSAAVCFALFIAASACFLCQVTGFVGDERAGWEELIRRMGAEMCKSLKKRGTTHLVCKEVSTNVERSPTCQGGEGSMG